MGTEAMTCCGALTRTYSEAGARTHNPGCPTQARAAADRLRADLRPGPFQPLGGWTHALPPTVAADLRTVLAAAPATTTEWGVADASGVVDTTDHAGRRLNEATARCLVAERIDGARVVSRQVTAWGPA